MKCIISAIFLTVLATAPASFAAPSLESPIHHQLQVQITPSLHQIVGEDEISELPFSSSIEFTLNKSLQIEKMNATLKQKIESPQFTESRYLVTLNPGETHLKLRYSGIINDPVVNESSTGAITALGASLFGSSFWYPQIEGRLLNFQLTATGPSNWLFISQGEPTQIGWQCQQPQEEIFLVGAEFKKFELPADGRVYSVYLRNDQKQADPTLAQKFLQLTPGYVSHYAGLIAPYPYPQFSAVENFWETGFGMPSFTLLGPSVVRLPFIFTSSYPHEILHNWWGNSVYVDFEKGNWSEGLTTYLGDHWQQEIIQQDNQYRLTTLLNYSSYVSAEADFPVREFRGRHNQSSQAVGYGKSMMFFHMLKVRFGAELFARALQDFYLNNQFKRASFSDIQTSFEKITGKNLQKLFSQWLDQLGSVHLNLTKASQPRPGELRLEISQSAGGTPGPATVPPYDLTIPVELTLESGKIYQTQLHLQDQSLTQTLNVNEKVRRVAIDPHYDVFRELYLEEKPATLSQLTGAQHIAVISNPRDADALSFLKSWQSQIEGSLDPQSETSQLPQDKPVLILGELGGLLPLFLDSCKAYGVEVNGPQITLGGQNFDLTQSAVVIAVRNKNNLAQTLTWVHWPTAAGSPVGGPVAEWATRLLHYGKYSALVFTGKPNIYKSTWTAKDSPLTKNF